MGLWSPQEQARQRALIRAAALPLNLPALEPAAVLDCLQSDKKVKDGKMLFVLPTAIGTVVIHDVDAATIIAAMATLAANP